MIHTCMYDYDCRETEHQLADLTMSEWCACVDELRDRHIPGGVYVAGVDDWRDCIDSCQLPCTAVDFDQNDLSCWHHHGPAACSLRKVYQPGVNHYRTVACLPQHRAPLISGMRLLIS